MAKYTPKLIERIVFLIEQDLYTVTEICRIVKVNRKTFYEWKNTKPEFSKAVDDAMEQRDEMLYSLARISLKQKLEGYTTEEEKVTYEPARSQPSELIEKSRVVKKKKHHADLRAIKYVMERYEKKKEKQREQQAQQQQNQPTIIQVRNDWEAQCFLRQHRINIVNSC